MAGPWSAISTHPTSGKTQSIQQTPDGDSGVKPGHDGVGGAVRSHHRRTHLPSSIAALPGDRKLKCPRCRLAVTVSDRDRHLVIARRYVHVLRYQPIWRFGGVLQQPAGDVDPEPTVHGFEASHVDGRARAGPKLCLDRHGILDQCGDIRGPGTRGAALSLASSSGVTKSQRVCATDGNANNARISGITASFRLTDRLRRKTTFTVSRAPDSVVSRPAIATSIVIGSILRRRRQNQQVWCSPMGRSDVALRPDIA